VGTHPPGARALSPLENAHAKKLGLLEKPGQLEKRVNDRARLFPSFLDEIHRIGRDCQN
jgi:hypothetical protein